MAFYKCQKGGGLLVPWSTGTVKQIKAMQDAYYAGDLSLDDIKSVWNVGAERTVSLSAMSATGVGESHAAQSVTMVIMNFGGKKLASDGTTDVLAIIGQKECLNESGYMHSVADAAWHSCARRTWCNSVYKNAIPSDFRALFKEFNNITARIGQSSSTITTADYFALASEKEVLGGSSWSNRTAEADNTQFAYYKTSSHRQKTQNGSAAIWWERSPTNTSYEMFCEILSSGQASQGYANSNNGLAPFGCI